MKAHIEHIREIVASEPNDMIMGGMIRKYFVKVDTPEIFKCIFCKTEVTEQTKSIMYQEPVCYNCANKQHQQRLGYDSFMNQYHKDHALCPKCKHSAHISTLAGFIVNMNKLDEYKDKNECTCTNCGDKHITHDRVSI